MRRTTNGSRARRWLFAILAVLMAIPAGATAAPETLPDAACANLNLNSIDKFLACVDVENTFGHLAAFQSFADASSGTRALGTDGYDATANYVAEVMEAAGLVVERQVFEVATYEEVSSSLSVDGVPIETQTFEFSESGTVTDGNVIAVDLQLGLGNASTSGCEASDFDGLDFSGTADIALLQRGACNFSAKAANAEAAGAEAAIIFNQGNADGRFGIIGGTLGGPGIGIPVLDVSYDDGVALSTTTGVVSLAAEGITTIASTENVIADLPGRNPDNVVIAGAHLDSVPEGPGIQDNGSGSAALLTVAQLLGSNRNYVPQNTLRFAWWGAEEAGLVGSDAYVFDPVFGLTLEEYEAIAAYVNFDMIASPNFIYGVYDADESTFTASAPVPPGSEALEDLFEAYYTIEGIPYEDTEFSGRSDYQAFINVGIPASGLFTGAEVLKTDEQASIWGGVAGEQFDQCYHLACDTFDNVSHEAMAVNLGAVAYAIYNLAATTEAVNGVPGVDPRGITPDEVVFDGPQGTFGP